MKISAHLGGSASLEGLATAILTMRWDDLEALAKALDEIRRVGTDGNVVDISDSPLTADLIHAWADTTAP